MSAEEIKRCKDLEAKKRRKAERKARKAGLANQCHTAPKADREETSHHTSHHKTPVAFVFPGQGSQAVGMLQVCANNPSKNAP